MGIYRRRLLHDISSSERQGFKIRSGECGALLITPLRGVGPNNSLLLRHELFVNFISPFWGSIGTKCLRKTTVWCERGKLRRVVANGSRERRVRPCHETNGRRRWTVLDLRCPVYRPHALSTHRQRLHICVFSKSKDFFLFLFRAILSTAFERFLLRGNQSKKRRRKCQNSLRDE